MVSAASLQQPRCVFCPDDASFLCHVLILVMVCAQKISSYGSPLLPSAGIKSMEFTRDRKFLMVLSCSGILSWYVICIRREAR